MDGDEDDEDEYFTRTGEESLKSVTPLSAAMHYNAAALVTQTHDGENDLRWFQGYIISGYPKLFLTKQVFYNRIFLLHIK